MSCWIEKLIKLLTEASFRKSLKDLNENSSSEIFSWKFFNKFWSFETKASRKITKKKQINFYWETIKTELRTSRCCYAINSRKLRLYVRPESLYERFKRTFTVWSFIVLNRSSTVELKAQKSVDNEQKGLKISEGNTRVIDETSSWPKARRMLWK